MASMPLINLIDVVHQEKSPDKLNTPDKLLVSLSILFPVFSATHLIQ